MNLGLGINGATAITAKVNEDQKNRLIRKIEAYMTWTAGERKTHEHGKLLTPAAYLTMRDWTSGINPVINPVIAVFEGVDITVALSRR